MNNNEYSYNYDGGKKSAYRIKDFINDAVFGGSLFIMVCVAMIIMNAI